MITREQFREHNGKRPFAPFRLVLVDGELLDVVRPNQAVPLTTYMMFVTPDDRLRRVRFDQVSQIQVLRPMAA